MVIFLDWNTNMAPQQYNETSYADTHLMEGWVGTKYILTFLERRYSRRTRNAWPRRIGPYLPTSYPRRLAEPHEATLLSVVFRHYLKESAYTYAVLWLYVNIQRPIGLYIHRPISSSIPIELGAFRNIERTKWASLVQHVHVAAAMADSYALIYN